MQRQIENGIRFFEEVRDIPYVLGLDGDPAKLRIENMGNCTRKCLDLAPRLAREKYDVLLALVAFTWVDVVPHFAHLLADPTDTHMCLKVRPPDHASWVFVDPAWDPQMAHYGFPVSEWDGVSDTGIGVIPRDTIKTESVTVFRAKGILRETATLLRGQSKNRSKPTPFNDAVNGWLGRG